MRVNWQLWLLVAVSVLLTCSSAVPVHSKDKASEEIAEQQGLVSRQPFTLFGVTLKPRVPLRLGGGGGLTKPKPNPAPPKPSNPAPAPSAPSKPVPSQSAPSSQATTSQATTSQATTSQATTSQATTSQITTSQITTSQTTTSQPSQISSASSQSASSISASSQSAASVSSSQVSSVQSSSTVSSDQVQTTRDPQDVGKCNKNGCSGAFCKAKRPKGKGTKPAKGKGARAIGSSVDVAARAFLPVNVGGNLANFPTDAQNQDLSSPDSRESTFMQFDAQSQQTIRVQGLAGCTVIAAVSPRGMIATHLFEHGDQEDAEGNITPDIGNTLHPDAFRATLVRARTFLSAHQADLAGGRLVVMLPTNKDGGQKKGKFRYDTESWPAIGKKNPNTFIKSRVKGDGIKDAIVQMAQQATGLHADIATYEVNTRDGPEPPPEAIDGTFVMQYDPNNAPNTANAAGVQVFIEGNERFQPVFHFPTPGAAVTPAPEAADPGAN